MLSGSILFEHLEYLKMFHPVCYCRQKVTAGSSKVAEYSEASGLMVHGRLVEHYCLIRLKNTFLENLERSGILVIVSDYDESRGSVREFHNVW
jgi:hypothetical protein